MRIIISLLLSLFLYSYSFGSHIRDILLDTEVSYDLKDTTLNSSSFQTQGIKARIVKIYPDQPINFNQLNSQILTAVNDLTNSPEVYSGFQQYYFESLKYNFKEIEKNFGKKGTDLLSRINGFTPKIKKIIADVYTLSGEMLILSFGLYYDAEYEDDEFYYSHNDQAYRMYRCFNIKSGKEINPLTIISTEKRTAFESLIRERIPEHFQNHITDEEIRHGLPIFHGAGFYYYLQGHGDYHEYFGSGIPNVCLRLELEEIKPFLDKKGPFSDYLKFTPSKKNVTGFLAKSYSRQPFCGEEDYYKIQRIEDFIEQIPANTGMRKSVVELKGVEASHSMAVETKYFKNGKPEWQVSYDHGFMNPIKSDSLSYHYKKGVLRAVDIYEISQKTKKLELKLRYHYDGNRNIERIYSYESTSDDVIEFTIVMVTHYTYFEDFVIIEDCFVSERGDYLIQDFEQVIMGDCYLNKNYSSGEKRGIEKMYEVNETKDSIKVIHTNHGRKTVTDLIEKKNDLVVSKKRVSNGAINKIITVEYNKNNLPVFYELSLFNTAKGEFYIQYKTTAEYSDKNLPIRLLTEMGDTHPRERDYIISYYK